MHGLPSPDVRAQLKRDHAHRYPELVTLRLPGDGGERVDVPLVLGNPSGACSMPEGMPVSSAWSNLVRAALGQRREGDVAGQVSADCILWPERSAWAKLALRWPGLPGSIVDEVRKKVGTVGAAVAKPFAGDEVPEPLAAALGFDARRVWLSLQPRPAIRYAVVIEPPAAGEWRLFQQALDQRDGDHWKQVRGFALRCVRVAVVRDGEEWKPITFSEIVDRFPGLVFGVTSQVNEMLGANAEAELGEL